MVFECDDVIGGLFCYGIFDFKLEKLVIDCCLVVMEVVGVCFQINVNVGENILVGYLFNNFDVVLLCGGFIVLCDLVIFGREFEGVYFVMDFFK